MTDYRFEYIKNQMTDELLVEQQKTNDETIQTLKEDIAILQEKLQKLEELQRTKSPVEEAYKKVYGYFPTEPNWDDDEVRWESFQKGYNASKVSETPQEPEELKTLYQMFENEGAYGQIYFDDALKVVKSWMSQYADNVMCGEYKKGYEECLTINLTLKELETLDKYLELNDKTRPLFDKIRNAYPKPTTLFDVRGRGKCLI